MMTKVAVIGSGISGLAAAYMLDAHYDVTVYEKNDYLGGHTRTVNINTRDNDCLAVDTGFIVFNHQNYPNLTALFHYLGVTMKKSDMSFGVSIDHGRLEYGSQKLANVFAQKRNLVNLKYLKFIKDILKFNQRSQQLIKNNAIKQSTTLHEYLNQLNVGQWFRDYYLFAMGAAIWSSPVEKIHDFPAESFIRFFYNHGLLSVSGQPQWYTLDKGNQQYVNRMINQMRGSIYKGTAVASIIRQNGKINITDNQGQIQMYDHVVLATHSDQALAMLSDASEDERMVLGSIRYQKNRMILHSDRSFMPNSPKAWSSWIYLANRGANNQKSVAFSYWMNNLQHLNTNQPVIVTLNPTYQPAYSLKHEECLFEHPVFNHQTLAAQNKLPLIQGRRNTWFAGAYWSYGFHEDGLQSAIDVARKLGVKPQWLNNQA